MSAPRTRAERDADRAAERIETAIKAARAVAATPEAKELHRRSKGKSGSWTAADEQRLRDGVIATPAGPYRLTPRTT